MKRDLDVYYGNIMQATEHQLEGSEASVAALRSGKTADVDRAASSVIALNTKARHLTKAVPPVDREEDAECFMLRQNLKRKQIQFAQVYETDHLSVPAQAKEQRLRELFADCCHLENLVSEREVAKGQTARTGLLARARAGTRR